MLSPLSSQEVRQAYEKRLGLDQPVYTQYFIYLSHLAKGDLGTSLVNGTPIRVDGSQLDAPDLRPGMRPETA